MKPFLILLAVLFYLALVSGRNLHDSTSEDESSNISQEKQVRDQTISQMRHRRRSRQSYNANYPYDAGDNYNRRYDHRRDSYSRQEELLSRILNQLEDVAQSVKYSSDNNYDRRYDQRQYFNNRQENELFSQILKQLDELSLYVKLNRSPPTPAPPQIFYIPYPYPVQCKQVQNQSNSFIPSFPTRIRPEDKYRNWGLVIGDLGLDNNDSKDGARPINLDPIEPEDTFVKPPPVDHGTSQAGVTTAKPTFNEPGRCKAAILVCCQDIPEQEKKTCFSNYGCNKVYSLPISCNPAVVKRVIAEFAEAYAPINNA